jgi:hypothetical protein
MLTGMTMKIITSAAAEIAVIRPVWIVTMRGWIPCPSKIRREQGPRPTFYYLAYPIVCLLKACFLFVLGIFDESPVRI